MTLKILHTADWHLGKRLDYFSRLQEQREVLQEICELADEQQADIVLIAGDLFDNFNPAIEAVELLYKTLKRLTNNGRRPVIAIAGNHDSPDRLDATDPLARACGILFMGHPNIDVGALNSENHWHISLSAPGFIEIQFAHIPFPVRIIATPFANEIRLKKYLGDQDKGDVLNTVLSQHWQQLADLYCDEKGVNILTTHLYMQKNGGEVLEEPEGERPLKLGYSDLVYTDGIPTQIQYTALGHLHRYHNIGSLERPIVYSSSPLCYSFSEAEQQKYVAFIAAQPSRPVQLQRIPLKAGRHVLRKTFSEIDEAVTWLSANKYALVELTIVSDSFLNPADLKRLHQAHDGIIHIIPVMSAEKQQEQGIPTINLQQDMDALFKDFFKFRQGQEPTEEIMEIFKEIVHSSTEKDS
ncbi:exonuclease subunit SbcD [Sphingobacteriaceae bacterium WQ 2009]|uniref:Nuclease SbcCD subunit D n=1 Tax=Rhinopithecimicrobium faecis TaxID=2820698 RepID=A0A8T4HA72_9SPHI|nr:exonuclease subunit SbcD [Sphingobacteriaceae bacterium WQ 2009]